MAIAGDGSGWQRRFGEVYEVPAADGWRAVVVLDARGALTATYSARLQDWDETVIARLRERASARERLKLVD